MVIRLRAVGRLDGRMNTEPEYWVDIKLMDGQSVTDAAYTLGTRDLE